MNLRFNPSLAAHYKNPAQQARVLTEGWAAENLYCPVCQQDGLNRWGDNTKIYDFACGRCAETFQLKSQKRPIGGKILDSAYQPMIQAMRTNRAPNFFLLHYDPLRLLVQNLLLIPRHFLSTSSIEARKPLSATARRAGWVGCLINLTQVPVQGRIFIVRNQEVQPTKRVRAQYAQFRFLSQRDWKSRGWTADVLACIDRLGKNTFTLNQMYTFEHELKALHPGNYHVRDKIRQQLQVLRDHGVLSFVERGIYQRRIAETN